MKNYNFSDFFLSPQERIAFFMLFLDENSGSTHSFFYALFFYYKNHYE